MKTKKAVIIGVNDYKNISDLNFTHADVALWKATLKAIDKDFEITTILDDKATKANILSAVRGLVNDKCESYFDKTAERKYKGKTETQQTEEIKEYPIIEYPCVRVLIFAGHGTNVLNAGPEEPDGLDEAICPYETEIEYDSNGNPFGKRSTVITDNEMVGILKSVTSPMDFYVVFDCCHSGDPGRGLHKPAHFNLYRGIGYRAKSSRFVRSIQGAQIPNVCWLSACKPDQTTPDSPSFSSFATVLARHSNATPTSVIKGSVKSLQPYGATPTLTDGAGLANYPIFQGKRRYIF